MTVKCEFLTADQRKEVVLKGKEMLSKLCTETNNEIKCAIDQVGKVCK